MSVLEDSGKELIHVEVKHDGIEPGYLYQAIFSDSKEMRVPNESPGPLGEEMITTQEVTLRMIEKTEVRNTYSFYLSRNRADTQ